MTREEARQYWQFRLDNAKDYIDPHWEADERRAHREYVEALTAAVEALTYQNLSKPNNTCEVDLVSRTDAIEAVCGDCTIENRESCKRDGYCYEVRNLMALPSEDRPTGWIPCDEMLPDTHTEYVMGNPWMQVIVGNDTYQLSDAVLGYGKRKNHSEGDPMVSVVWYEDDGDGRTGWQTAPDCEDIDVVAWMPLPERFERKDDDDGNGRG